MNEYKNKETNTISKEFTCDDALAHLHTYIHIYGVSTQNFPVSIVLLWKRL